MSVTSDICTYAFAALALLSSGQALAQPAVTPTRAFPGLQVDVERNSYKNIISELQYGKVYEVVNCTTGLISQFGGNNYNPGGGLVSVTQLTPAAQGVIRANCNSHGLRAGF